MSVIGIFFNLFDTNQDKNTPIERDEGTIKMMEYLITTVGLNMDIYAEPKPNTTNKTEHNFSKSL